MLSFVELLEHVGQLYSFMFHHFSSGHENFIANKTAACEVAPSDVYKMLLSPESLFIYLVLKFLSLFHYEIFAEYYLLSVCVDCEHGLKVGRRRVAA